MKFSDLEKKLFVAMQALDLQCIEYGKKPYYCNSYKYSWRKGLEYEATRLFFVNGKKYKDTVTNISRDSCSYGGEELYIAGIPMIKDTADSKKREVIRQLKKDFFNYTVRLGNTLFVEPKQTKLQGV